METFMLCYAFGILFAILAMCVYFTVKYFLDRRRYRYEDFVARSKKRGSVFGDLLRAAARNNGNPK